MTVEQCLIIATNIGTRNNNNSYCYLHSPVVSQLSTWWSGSLFLNAGAHVQFFFNFNTFYIGNQTLVPAAYICPELLYSIYRETPYTSLVNKYINQRNFEQDTRMSGLLRQKPTFSSELELVNRAEPRMVLMLASSLLQKHMDESWRISIFCLSLVSLQIVQAISLLEREILQIVRLHR